MGKFYSLDLRERAVAAYLGGESCRSVGAGFQVAPSNVVKWAGLLKRQGDLKPGKVGGHRPTLLEPHLISSWPAFRTRAPDLAPPC